MCGCHSRENFPAPTSVPRQSGPSTEGIRPLPRGRLSSGGPGELRGDCVRGPIERVTLRDPSSMIPQTPVILHPRCSSGEKDESYSLPSDELILEAGLTSNARVRALRLRSGTPRLPEAGRRAQCLDESALGCKVRTGIRPTTGTGAAMG